MRRGCADGNAACEKKELWTFEDREPYVTALPPLYHSFKKASSAELVLNIICSEQDLAQQKVSLAMAMLNPEDLSDEEKQVVREIRLIKKGKQ